MSESPAAPAGAFPVPGLRPPTQRTGAKRRIGDVIVQLGFAERELVEKAVDEGRANGVPLGQSLIDAGIVDSNQLAQALAERNGLDYVDLNSFEVDQGAANLIDAAKARRYQTIPISFLGEQTRARRDRRPGQRARARRHRDGHRLRGAPRGRLAGGHRRR